MDMTPEQKAMARALAPEAHLTSDSGARPSPGENAAIAFAERAVTILTPLLARMGLAVGPAGSPEEEMQIAAAGIRATASRLSGIDGARADDLSPIVARLGICADSIEQSSRSVPEDDGFPRVRTEWPEVGDRVAMSIDEDVEIEIADVSNSQPNLTAGVWTVTDANGDVHLVEDADGRWETVNPAIRADVVHHGSEVELSFDAFLLDEGVDDGDGSPERMWRGVLVRDGEPVRTTDLLYATSQEACLAATEIESR